MRSAVTASRRRFSQEFKDELSREVISASKTIKEVALGYGVGPETLRNWLIKYREANGGTEAELTLTERARLKELERLVLPPSAMLLDHHRHRAAHWYDPHDPNCAPSPSSAGTAGNVRSSPFNYRQPSWCAVGAGKQTHE